MAEGAEDEVVIDRLVIDLPAGEAEEDLSAAIARELLARFEEWAQEG